MTLNSNTPTQAKAHLLDAPTTAKTKEELSNPRLASVSLLKSGGKCGVSNEESYALS